MLLIIAHHSRAAFFSAAWLSSNSAHVFREKARGRLKNPSPASEKRDSRPRMSREGVIANDDDDDDDDVDDDDDDDDDDDYGDDDQPRRSTGTIYRDDLPRRLRHHRSVYSPPNLLSFNINYYCHLETFRALAHYLRCRIRLVSQREALLCRAALIERRNRSPDLFYHNGHR
jgi:hypothetical protein